jgi:hypothetical protein
MAIREGDLMGRLRLGMRHSVRNASGEALYVIDQGSPCPLATLNPFGRELLLSDGFTGIKRSTWI